VFGHDAGVRLPGRAIIVMQFKFSQDQAAPFDLGDLHKVLDAFDRSSQSLGRGETFTHFVLITNRHPGDETRAVYQARNSGQAPGGLLPHGNSELRKKAESRHGNTAATEAAWHSTLQRTLFCTNISLARWEGCLRQYAEALGVRPDELPRSPIMP
jgi:hypothetical protein